MANLLWLSMIRTAAVACILQVRHHWDRQFAQGFLAKRNRVCRSSSDSNPSVKQNVIALHTTCHGTCYYRNKQSIPGSISQTDVCSMPNNCHIVPTFVRINIHSHRHALSGLSEHELLLQRNQGSLHRKMEMVQLLENQQSDVSSLMVVLS